MCVRDSATQHHKGGEAADLNTVDTGNTSGHAMTNFILLTSLLAYGGSSFPIKMSITYDMIRGRRRIIARSSPTDHHSSAFKDRIFWYISASPWPNLLGKSNNKMAHWLSLSALRSNNFDSVRLIFASNKQRNSCDVNAFLAGRIERGRVLMFLG